MPHVESKLIRVTNPADPERCQASYRTGQCPYKADPGSTRCGIHAADTAKIDLESTKLRNYRLGKWDAKVAHFGNSDEIKSLRDEIGITRVMLEEIITKCGDDQDLLFCSPRINDLIDRIQKLVLSCHKLEASTGKLLDKAAALNLASKMVEIISNHITDPDLVSLIAEEIAKEISK